MARPTKYKKEYCEKVEHYLEECQKKSQGGDEVYLPTVEGVALLLDVNKQTLYNWKEKYDEFFDVLEKVKKKQKQMLVNNGLSGDYNSTITKLILSADHGMKERADITSEDESIKPDEVKVEIVDNEQTES